MQVHRVREKHTSAYVYAKNKKNKRTKKKEKTLPFLIPVVHCRKKISTWDGGAMHGDYRVMINERWAAKALFIVNDNGGWGVRQLLCAGNAVLRDYVNATWAFLRNGQRWPCDIKLLNWSTDRLRACKGVAHKSTRGKWIPPMRAFGIPTGHWRTQTTDRIKQRLTDKLTNRHKGTIRDDIDMSIRVLWRIIKEHKPTHVVFCVDKSRTRIGTNLFSRVTDTSVFEYIFKCIRQLHTPRMLT